MMQGMAFGAGSAVAHQAIGRMMGGGSSGNEGGHTGDAPAQQQQQYGAGAGGMDQAQYSEQQQVQENPCMSFNQSLLQCL